MSVSENQKYVMVMIERRLSEIPSAKNIVNVHGNDTGIVCTSVTHSDFHCQHCINRE
jgi:hypothetical protein